MKPVKSLSITIKELSHQKIILAAWYNFLKEGFDSQKITSSEFSDFLQAHVMYDLDQDQIELVLQGSDELLESFRNSIFQK